jgi:hypothetical protein
MLEKLQALPEEINRTEQLLADAGYFSEANVTACDSAGIEPAIAIKRDEHHPHWSERFESPQAPPAEALPVERMAHRPKTPKGRATYALRKQTVEPVFGIIKSVMGFRQFLTRGLDNVQSEWTLVRLAWAFKRMAVLRPQSGKSGENRRFSPKSVSFAQQTALRSLDASTPVVKSDRLLVHIVGGLGQKPQHRTAAATRRDRWDLAYCGVSDLYPCQT